MKFHQANSKLEFLKQRREIHQSKKDDFYFVTCHHTIKGNKNNFFLYYIVITYIFLFILSQFCHLKKTVTFFSFFDIFFHPTTSNNINSIFHSHTYYIHSQHINHTVITGQLIKNTTFSTQIDYNQGFDPIWIKNYYQFFDQIFPTFFSKTTSPTVYIKSTYQLYIIFNHIYTSILQ